MKRIDVYNTHIEVYPYKPGDVMVIEKMYTAVDKFSQSEYPCGYLVDNNILYLPRGTPVSKLEYILNTKARYISMSDPKEKMHSKHYALYDLKDDLQRDTVDFLLGNDKHQLSVNNKMGTGKMQPYSERIPTPEKKNGFTTMGELVVGSTIFGRDGKPNKVLEIFEHGVQPVYRITFEDGRTTSCGLDHLWHIYADSYEMTLTLNEIIKYRNRYDDHVYVPLCEPVQYSFKLASDKNTNYQVIGHSIGLHNDYTFLNEYLYCDVAVRLGLLLGASVNYGIIEDDILMFDNPNIEMLKYLQRLSYSLGLKAAIDGTRLSIWTTHEVESYMMQDNHKVLSSYDRFQANRLLMITDIEHTGYEKCRCIRVSSPDHLYLTGDYIVTHNTFCTAYAINELNERAIVIVPNEQLKMQWMVDTFNKMFDYRPSDLMNIQGSAIVDGIVNGDIEPREVHFVNHATLRNYLVENGGEAFRNFFRKLKVGIKVYDEAHLEFANIIMIDQFTNTNRTWYLTATFDRNDKTESACFKRAFNGVMTFGEMESERVVEKHVVYHVVPINSRPTPKERGRVYGYTGFNAISYGKYAFIDDKREIIYHAILMLLEKLTDVEGKILIFVPLIEAVDRVVNYIKKHHPQKDVAAYHSKIPQDEKQTAKKKDIIVSTIRSCGTGVDIKELRCCICAEPIAGKVGMVQLVGRLRPYKDKETYFFDLYDTAFPAANFWHRARMRAIERMVKSIVYLNIDK